MRVSLAPAVRFRPVLLDGSVSPVWFAKLCRTLSPFVLLGSGWGWGWGCLLYMAIMPSERRMVDIFCTRAVLFMGCPHLHRCVLVSPPPSPDPMATPQTPSTPGEAARPAAHPGRRWKWCRTQRAAPRSCRRPPWTLGAGGQPGRPTPC